jgi:hypothetical protein
MRSSSVHCSTRLINWSDPLHHSCPVPLPWCRIQQQPLSTRASPSPTTLTRRSTRSCTRSHTSSLTRHYHLSPLRQCTTRNIRIILQVQTSNCFQALFWRLQWERLALRVALEEAITSVHRDPSVHTAFGQRRLQVEPLSSSNSNITLWHFSHRNWVPRLLMSLQRPCRSISPLRNNVPRPLWGAHLPDLLCLLLLPTRGSCLALLH